MLINMVGHRLLTTPDLLYQGRLALSLFSLELMLWNSLLETTAF